MGRRRWRFVTIAAFLLIFKDIRCQDESDFYYTPVERSFAQVQPPLFPNSRPTTFFEHPESIRLSPNSQQTPYSEGHVRFPSPNYNQNPTPFQIPTGRSQSGGQFYVNQPEISGSQRQRFRPSLPHNYQIIYTTKKPEIPQIHSAAYQNDPSKPETFLGQITLNNPDIDYLQNNRFKNIPFDSNSLRSNGQSGHITHDEDINGHNIFEHHKVTTYNPNQLVNKQEVYNRPSGSRYSHFESSSNNRKRNSTSVPIKIISNHHANSPYTSSDSFGATTESKALLELEPLLEEDISDFSTFRELMKNTHGSYDVQVIKSNNSISEVENDNKPDASFMSADKTAIETPTLMTVETTSMKSTTKVSNTKESHDSHDYSHSEEKEEGNEYEYYDETDSNETKHATQEPEQEPQTTEHVTDIYDEYDSAEEAEKTTEIYETSTESQEISVNMHDISMAKKDNLKTFENSTLVEQIKPASSNSEQKNDTIYTKNESPVEEASILGKEIVSVVTTKSVVNGTISIPDMAHPTSTETINTMTNKMSSADLNLQNNDTAVTTENWIVASVQTSRSVSGARFLPFPTVEHEEQKQVLTDEDDDQNFEMFVTKDPKINSSSSTENINDKLDSIQSELSSAVLTGTLDKENKHFEVISESTPETTFTTSPSSLNVFTLKSTPPLAIIERSSPDPLPVTIKKFTPRLGSSTTPKPKRKLVTIMEDVNAFLPPGYKPRLSFKDKRITTTTSTTPASSPKDELVSNGAQGRSSGISVKNKVILLDDKSLLPKEYTPKESKPQEDTKTVMNEDISKFLPPGYKTSILNESHSEKTESPLISNIKKDDISKFLPPGYKTSILNESHSEKTVGPLISNIKKDDISKFLPPGYKSNLEESKKSEELDIIKLQKDDINKFLPPGYKLPSSETSDDLAKPDISKLLNEAKLLPQDYKQTAAFTPRNKEKFKSHRDEVNKFGPLGHKAKGAETSESKPTAASTTTEKVTEIDVSSILPKNFTLNTTDTEKSIFELKLPIKIVPVDVTALLPPGFKLNTSEKDHDNTLNFKIPDVSNLLPPGFKLNTTDERIETSSTTKAPGGIKLIFPSRPGAKTARKTTPKPIGSFSPTPIAPKINKGWPVRVSTEFTGWPSPSTTPFSIEKLLEAQRNATASAPLSDWSTEPTTQRLTTTTTTTTPAPPPPTTPGICQKECELAATIKIVGGVKWIPEFQDPHTEEWQRLAKEVKDELNSVYSNSDLKKWYKTIRIDGFSKGSVLVDYFIELNNVEEKVDTLELKKLFHKSLTKAKPEVVVESVEETAKDSFNPDAMLGDQPDEDRMRKSNEKMTKTIDKSTGKLEIGKFIMDPAYTEFIVVHKREETPKKIEQPEEESFLPQWGIAVIVIALASLLFVVIFGVTVLVNRQKNFRAKQPIPLSEDMLRELDKSHMGGFEEIHQMKERELPYPPSGKRMSTAFIEQLAYPNPGDSWRSEWTPQMQKYMQHYAPDSGRGSQIYGPAGNAYGYSGSQLYGQTGGGSQVYGYTGEYPRSHHSRRRSEYDSNF